MPEDGPFELFPWQVDSWQQLQARREQGTFPHALLLSGPDGIGKRQFAARLAASLVCETDALADRPCGHCRSCVLAVASTHPDIHWLEPEEQGKNIKIDAVRGLIERTTLTTQAKGSRVFVISPAHAMNRASSNALLKTLEEPTASSSLVLLSSRPHLLPATIRSRCQEMLFKPVSAQDAETWLTGRVDPQQLSALLALSGGAPLRALCAAEENWLARAADTLQRLLDLKSRKANPLQVVEHWQQLPLDGLLEDISRTCSDLLQLGSSSENPRLFMPQSTPQLQSLARDINLKKLFRFIDELNLLRRQMTHNLNPQMLLEKVVNDWLLLTRPERH